ncbi:TPA: HAD-IA family hydrolase [Candidatus Micrarchaeota archaeon]|nr:HAD-IA family hydrolase [Candidatus Micrarchaeota archaeon]
MYFKIPAFGFISEWHVITAVVLAGIFYSLNFMPGLNGVEAILYLLVAFALSFPVFNAVKRIFFRRIIAFDMGGVFMTGDFKFERMKPVNEMVVFIKKLRTNYTTALLSNQPPDAYDNLRRKFNFDSMFDYQIIPMHAMAEKPDVKIYETLLRRTGRKPADIIFIDDMEANVIAARKLGMKGIVFKNMAQLKEALAACGINA